MPGSPDRSTIAEHRIGPDDLLDFVVFEAPELNRKVRVSGRGDISLPLLGEVRAAGRTPRELELALEERLRASYMLDPHVSVQVSEVQSRPVSVVGAVNRPGVYQVAGSRSLLEVLALAGGLSDDAGDGVLVIRAGTSAPAIAGDETTAGMEGQEIDLRDLLESPEPRHNVPVFAGDVVAVKRSGLVYVVGEVERPGAFPINPGSEVTLLQALAMGQGFRPTAAKGRILIIRGSRPGERTEIAVDFGDVVSGRTSDPVLQPKDVVFVPNSSARSVAFGVIDALVRMVTLRGIF